MLFRNKNPIKGYRTHKNIGLLFALWVSLLQSQCTGQNLSGGREFFVRFVVLAVDQDDPFCCADPERFSSPSVRDCSFFKLKQISNRVSGLPSHHGAGRRNS